MKDTPLELIVSDRGRVSVTFDGKIIPATSVEIIHDPDGVNNHAIITIPMKIIRVGSKPVMGKTRWINWEGSLRGNGWLPHPKNVTSVLLRDGSEYSFGWSDFVYRWDWIAGDHESHSGIDIVAYKEGV